MFAALPDKPDHDALERADPRPAGTASAPSTSSAPRTPTGPGSASSTARSRPTSRSPCTRRGVARSRTSSSATRRSGATTSATRTASTARGSGSRSASSGSSASTRSARSRSSGWPSSPAAAGPSSSGPPPTSPTGSIRLGQWMDWGRDYFTFSDTNIEYIWRFLAIVHERGWLYRGHRSTEWCPRCGTSISAHELAGSYVDREDPSLSVRFPLLDRPGPGASSSGPPPRGRCRPTWPRPSPPPPSTGASPTATGWPSTAAGRAPSRRSCRGARARRACATRGPSTRSGPGAEVEHRVIGWDEVSLEEGTGVVHIAPGCGTEDFELSKVEDLAVLTPVDESGPLLPGRTAGSPGARRPRRRRRHHRRPPHARPARRRRHDPATATPSAGAATRPLIFRISDDWFISVDEIREPMRDANRTVEWTPEYMGKRMDDWLVNMSDWNISRRRYYGLPLPFYPCSCGHLTVIGSRAAARRAGHRRRSTASRSSAGRGSTTSRSAASSAATR